MPRIRPGAGLGHYLAVGLATALVLTVLWAVPRLRGLTQARKTFVYEVIFTVGEKKCKELERMTEGNGLLAT
ncbi:hypothetical protein ACFLWA_07325 [Chloroflexota bacterium]